MSSLCKCAASNRLTLERCVAALLQPETLDEPALLDLTRDLKHSEKAEKTAPRPARVTEAGGKGDRLTTAMNTVE